EPRIRLLSGREAFLRLSAHRGCRIRWREEEEFRLFSRLIHEVPVVACQVPRDRAKLRDLFSRMRRVLEEDFSEAAGAVASR
ncbi:hypothetical protein, partial [Methylacidimicrobium cyclopophantes]|uniref:hypothetical protein n=1 Tax=Methylacidimicrobium cyclopophantes TaxID=1041766 RepID=UPI0015B3C398